MSHVAAIMIDVATTRGQSAARTPRRAVSFISARYRFLTTPHSVPLSMRTAIAEASVAQNAAPIQKPGIRAQMGPTPAVSASRIASWPKGRPSGIQLTLDI
jgi:hypothetical protein